MKERIRCNWCGELVEKDTAHRTDDGTYWCGDCVDEYTSEYRYDNTKPRTE